MKRSTFNSIFIGILCGLIASACTSKALRDASKQLQNSNDTRAQLIGNSIAGSQKLTPQDEREMGAELAGALIKIHGLHPNENLQKYVNTLGSYLGKQSTMPKIKWRFAVLNTDDINAFSTPAGFILVSHGLIKLMNDEAELAGVLSHEIIHVTEKHHLLAIQKSSRAAGVANIGKLVEEKKKGETSEKVGQLLQVGSEVFARGLDKKDEFTADQRGILLSSKSGYDAYGLIRVLTSLNQINPTEGKIALLFKTHPSSDERLAQIEKNLLATIEKSPEGLSLKDAFVAATR